MKTLLSLNNGLSVWDLFDSNFNDSFNNFNDSWRRNIIPHNEDENGYSYFLNLAGFKKEDLEASVVDGLAVIKAKNKDGATAHYSFLLPEDSNPSKMSAKLEDGLLTVNVEKQEKVKLIKLKID